MKYFLTILPLAMLVVWIQNSSAQVSPGEESSLQLLLGGGEKSNAETVRQPTGEQMPFSRTIDPDYYVCGPGDQMALVLTKPFNLTTPLVVSADGSLVIPRVGAVHVAGLTLSAARATVFSTLQQKYPEVQGTLSLLQSRPIIVQVVGQVKSPGIMNVTAGTPVSVALMLANVEPETKAASGFTPPAPGAPNVGYRARLARRYFGSNESDPRSLRRITIRHTDGSTDRADLIRFLATNDPAFDPFLREGDVVVVPPRQQNAPSIGIFGAVRSPGSFEFLPGDKLSDLVKMGFGIRHDVDITSATLFRSNGENVALSVEDLLRATPNPDIPLQPGDRLIVFANFTRASTGSVAVDGEVRSPGVFPIVPGVTRLTEVVKAAGGFTGNAWPSLCELYRRQIGIDGAPIDLNREAALNFQRSNLYVEDTLHWRNDSRVREGKVAVDFHRLFVLNDSTADVALEDGDILLVPRNTGTVYVFGQVNNPGFIPYVEGKDFDWYIEQAKGYAEEASTGRARIIKANTRAWMDPDDTVIEPGDMIFVPHTPLVRLSTTSDILSVAASIIGAVTGITSLVIAILR
ncbi:MAG: hypothetical protein GXO82_10205 [Chlorobi bacterium]|nr:hypothetical protein [Chlorobiota bacterium]